MARYDAFSYRFTTEICRNINTTMKRIMLAYE